eukprot:TRINITY_DN27849_c0_g1_i1.p1 TRINITY_DN27849_c0_g1~~TRINITY_DN27849_c0_g1_i1.p1  ORF type:complete len:558 (+),score=88.28 TRINITY_DN27849_c0_g1_i1:55-1728(+)
MSTDKSSLLPTTVAEAEKSGNDGKTCPKICSCLEPCVLCTGCCAKTCCREWCCCICIFFAFKLCMLIMLVLPGFFSATFGLVWCHTTTCINVFDSERSENCEQCSETYRAQVTNIPVGANSIPLGYFTSPNGLRVEPHLTERPVYDYDRVVAEGKKYPAKIYSGEWWRGNELGGIVNNPYFWSSSGINPMSIALGVTSKQHSVIRPYFVEAFAPPSDDGEWIRKSLRSFLKARRDAGELQIPVDITAWFHQVLMKRAFDVDLSWDEAIAFTSVQSSMTAMGTVSQVFPGAWYGSIDLLHKTRAGATEYVRKYTQLSEKIWGEKLAKLDCAPSPNCSLQLGSGMWDALYSAGGLSVPGGIQSGLAILYSTSSTNPSPSFKIPKGKELEFFWETIRFIAPVYGFPHWSKRPTCPGLTSEETEALNKDEGRSASCPLGPVNPDTDFPLHSQWEGGYRVLLSLKDAQTDPKAWGSNAHEFVLRPLEDYNKKSMGFAEMATDPSVDNGNSDRVCPGKELALITGKIFWEEFDASAWKATDSDISIDPDGALIQVPSFTLEPV